MKTQELLALWRERWEKPPQEVLLRPLTNGRLAQKLRQLALANFWQIPGLAAVCGVIFFSLASMPLTMVAQIFVSGFLCFFAVILHRQRGLVPALVITGIAAFLSIRYFIWRVTSTLAPTLGWDFAIGFMLCCVEIIFWLEKGLTWIQQIWPLHRPPETIQQEALYWPTLDIVLYVDHEPLDVLERSWKTVQSQNWPLHKLNFYLLTLDDRPDITEFAEIKKWHVLKPSSTTESASHVLQQAWQQLQGDLLLIIEKPANFEGSFLQKICAPFVNHPRMGLLSTPHNSWLPPPKKAHASLIHSETTSTPFILMRRSAVEEAGGLIMQPPTHACHLGLAIAKVGFACAYVNPVDGSRIDSPFPSYMVTFRQKLCILHEALGFYGQLLVVFLILMPFVVLIWQMQPVRVSWGELVVYAGPHFFLGFIIWAARQERSSLSLLNALHERLLGWMLILRTARSYGYTMVRRIASGRIFTLSARLHPPAHLSGWSNGLLCTGMMVFAILAWRDLQKPSVPAISLLYYLWIACIFFQYMAYLAVQEELARIRAEKPMRACLPAMLRLPSGHQLQGTTTNFPSLNLKVQLRQQLPLATAQEVYVSLFRGAFEYSVAAYVKTVCDQEENAGKIVELELFPADMTHFHAFARAVYSRDPGWPAWLPGAYADQLLPRWMQRIVLSATEVFYHLVLGSAIQKKYQKLLAWVFSLIKKND